MPRVKTDFPGIYLPAGAKTYYTRKFIPAAVRHMFGGKPAFVQTTGERDRHKAYAASLPLQAEWQARIDAALAGRDDPNKAEILRLANEYKEKHGGELTEDKAAFLYDVMAFAFEELGGMTAATRRAIMDANRHTTLSSALASVSAAAATGFDQITGKAAPPALKRTPFLQHLDGFEKGSHLRGKHLESARSEIKQFAEHHPDASLETVTQTDVQLWVRDLASGKHGKPNLPATIRHKLNSLRQYYTWLAEGGIIDKAHKPFDGIVVRDTRSKVEIEEAKRKPWTLRQLGDLITKAADDVQLINAIRLAYYTGSRRENVCGLTVNDIHIDPDTGIRYIHFTGKGAKMRPRDVPVHPALSDLLDSLIANANGGGHLIHDGTFDEHGFRGKEIGNRFSALKASLGYDCRYVFHCIRKTTSLELRKAKVDPFMRDELCGWQESGAAMRELYAGAADLREKAEAIAKLPPLPV